MQGSKYQVPTMQLQVLDCRYYFAKGREKLKQVIPTLEKFLVNQSINEGISLVSFRQAFAPKNKMRLGILKSIRRK